jgi:DNA-binding GntR family transcriptional regulator
LIISSDVLANRQPEKKGLVSTSTVSRRAVRRETGPGHGPSSPDQLVAALNEGIQLARYVPGQRLIEADLTAEYGVSRGTVREALKRLSAEGLIELVAHRGAYVRSLSRSDMHDILAVFERLATLAAGLAAERIGETDHRVKFRAALDKVLRFRNHPAGTALMHARTGFYNTLVRIGGNRELVRSTPLVQIHLMRMQFRQMTPVASSRHFFDEYEAIAAAVLAGDVRRAESAMRRHLRRTRTRLDRLPDSMFAGGS